jgi:hypothetical protein
MSQTRHSTTSEPSSDDSSVIAQRASESVSAWQSGTIVHFSYSPGASVVYVPMIHSYSNRVHTFDTVTVAYARY